MLGKEPSSSGTGWYIYYNTTDFRPNFQRAGVAVGSVSAAGALSTSGYKYYVLTYDAATATLRWYFNGALDRTYTGVSFPTSTDNSALELGRGYQYGYEFLDEVALYDSALSPSGVAARYAAATRGCSDIAGATGTSYTLTSGDVGTRVRVRVSASNRAGTAIATSQPTGLIDPVGGMVPVNYVPPSISGVPRQGEALSASVGTWSGTNPIGYAYQWQRCDSSGASCVSVAVRRGRRTRSGRGMSARRYGWW